MQHDFHFTAAALAAAIALAAVPASAANNKGGGGSTTAGVIVIDQARAAAGGITPGDAPGFPVTLSQPGSYRLMSNLAVTDPTVHGIEVASDHVTLDFNGFQITGSVACTGTSVATLACSPAATNGIGVAADSRRFVDVQGGSVTGFRSGVHVGDHGRISGMRISHMNTTGIFGGKHTLIDDNRIYLVKGRGIHHEGIARGNQVHLAGVGIDVSHYGLNLNNFIFIAQMGIVGWVGGGASVGGNMVMGTSVPMQNHLQVSPNQCGSLLCANFY